MSWLSYKTLLKVRLPSENIIIKEGVSIKLNQESGPSVTVNAMSSDAECHALHYGLKNLTKAKTPEIIPTTTTYTKRTRISLHLEYSSDTTGRFT
jgi:hypothetical protein